MSIGRPEQKPFLVALEDLVRMAGGHRLLHKHALDARDVVVVQSVHRGHAPVGGARIDEAKQQLFHERFRGLPGHPFAVGACVPPTFSLPPC